MPILLGLLLALPDLWKNRKKQGGWRINWPRLLIIGLPALVGATWYLLSFVLPIGYYIPNGTFPKFCGILLGFTILRSVERKEAIKNERASCKER